MSFALNLAKLTAENILPAAIVGNTISFTTANVFNSEKLMKFRDLPQTVTAALFAVAFFGTETATVATAFAVAHVTIKLIDLCLSNQSKQKYNFEGQVLDRAFRVSAEIANAAAAVFMAYTNPASMLNIVGAISLGSTIVNNAACAFRGEWDSI